MGPMILYVALWIFLFYYMDGVKGGEGGGHPPSRGN